MGGVSQGGKLAVGSIDGGVARRKGWLAGGSGGRLGGHLGRCRGLRCKCTWGRSAVELTV